MPTPTSTAITSRWTGSILFSLDTPSLKLALEAAIKSDADLRDADLTRADLRGADFTGADLTPVRDDLWAVLSSAPAEVEGLRTALVEGRVDGSTYEGECACLVGTLANVRQCKYSAITGLSPDSRRPAERFFLAINPGDTPENSVEVKLAVEWIDQWLATTRGACGAFAK